MPRTGEGASPRGLLLARLRSRLGAHPVVLWCGFLLAHLWVGWLALTGPGFPMGDVDTYAFWVRYGLEEGVWVGIDTLWVYPIGALAPMLAAAAAGFDAYRSLWVSLVLVADILAFAVVLGPRVRAARIAWWWSAFVVLLGPIAVARIDAFAVAAALCGVAVLAARPGLAGSLLAVATWIKVWPAAVLAGAVVVIRQRLALALGAAAVSLAVIILMVLLGGGATVFSFLGTQNDRGLQIEAVLATPLMWLSARGHPAAGDVYFDSDILTFQLDGPAAQALASGATPLLIAVGLALLVLGLVARRRGAEPAAVLPPLLTALTVAMIVGNKVGSPQFASWLAVPILYGLLAARLGQRRFTVPAALTLAVAALTQLIYPTFYAELVGLSPALLVVLTSRNLLYLAILGWAVVVLARLCRRPAISRVTPTS